jgi:hypothetical protein
MAVTITKVTGGNYNIGNKKVRSVQLTFTGSYTTGGETVTPTQIGARRILGVLAGSITEAAGQTTCWFPHWDGTKVKLFGAGTGATGLTEHAAAAYAASTTGLVTFICE